MIDGFSDPAPRLVLASTSRYRRDLLARLQMPFAIANPSIEETALPEESPRSMAVRLAGNKAAAVRSAYPDALIIGSDQVAVVNGEVLGKPGDHSRAVSQLQRVSGKHVEFLTAVCLLNARTDEQQTYIETIKVKMRELDNAEIERYLSKDQPYDCAGSAKIEGLGIALIETLDCPDPSALIGLPLIVLCRMLRKAGVVIP
jgi:septum formation protein